VLVATQLGHFRALVNYTGSMRVALIETVDDAYLKTSLDLDLGGIVRTCSCAAPYFAAHASVVNVGGVAWQEAPLERSDWPNGYFFGGLGR
jgi:NADP-dependent 3-hydroxy acid dehydrogenase YdfG